MRSPRLIALTLLFYDESDDNVQKAKSARLGVLGSNSDARVSHLNVNGDPHSDDDYEFVGGQRSSRADEPDQRRGGGLSAKAGIILVRRIPSSPSPRLTSL